MKVWLVTGWGLAAFAAVMVLFVLVQPAGAQSLCAPLPDLLASLQRNFGEFIVLDAEAGDGSRLLITRADSGSWSAVSAREDVGCLLYTGKKSAFDNGI